MFKFIWRMIDGPSDAEIRGIVIIREQAERIEELVGDLHKQRGYNMELKLLVKSLQDKQEGNTRPLGEFRDELAKRSNEIYQHGWDDPRKWGKDRMDREIALRNTQEDLYTWRMDK